MLVPHVIAERTNPNACPLPFGEFVRRAGLYDGVEVGFYYSGPAQYASVIKQSGFPRSRGRQWARSKSFLGAKSSRGWASTPVEVSNTLRDAGDLVGSSSAAGHWTLVVLRSVRCLLPHGVRNKSLSLSEGTGFNLVLTRVLGDR